MKQERILVIESNGLDVVRRNIQRFSKDCWFESIVDGSTKLRRRLLLIKLPPKDEVRRARVDNQKKEQILLKL